MVQRSISQELAAAAEEGFNPVLDDTEEQLQEEIEDFKVEFDLVRTEVKEAAQEAISKRTIQAYKK
jgi:hypothetical protein